MNLHVLSEKKKEEKKKEEEKSVSILEYCTFIYFHKSWLKTKQTHFNSTAIIRALDHKPAGRSIKISHYKQIINTKFVFIIFATSDCWKLLSRKSRY